MLEAFVYTVLGDKAKAVGALETYIAANPDRRQAVAQSGWWFRSLESDPDFQSLVGTSQ